MYAVGDIVGLQLAHRSFQQGIFVAETSPGSSRGPSAEAGIPRVTYSHPEVASVGLTEEAAAAALRLDGIRVAHLRPRRQRQGRSPLKTQGFVKLGAPALTARSSASTWSATASGELIGRHS